MLYLLAKEVKTVSLKKFFSNFYSVFIGCLAKGSEDLVPVAAGYSTVTHYNDDNTVMMKRHSEQSGSRGHVTFHGHKHMLHT